MKEDSVCIREWNTNRPSTLMYVNCGQNLDNSFALCTFIPVGNRHYPFGSAQGRRAECHSFKQHTKDKQGSAKAAYICKMFCEPPPNLMPKGLHSGTCI